jgi:hypothetical protein
VVVSSRLVRSVPKGGRRVTRGSTLGRSRMSWQVRQAPEHHPLAGQIGPSGSVLAEDPSVRWPSIGSLQGERATGTSSIRLHRPMDKRKAGEGRSGP